MCPYDFYTLCEINKVIGLIKIFRSKRFGLHIILKHVFSRPRESTFRRKKYFQRNRSKTLDGTEYLCDNFIKIYNTNFIRIYALMRK